jgi:hypothetical protein
MAQQDLTSMFDNEADLATRIEMASHMLKQAADDQGVDLSTFSQEDLSEMLSDIVTDNGTANDNGKTASDAVEVTFADVSLELTKRAAAEGVDLTELDRDTYEELFSKVAEELTNPEFAEEASKIAAQEAHMEELGRVAARGFVDEINKLAADEEKKEDKKDDDDDDDKEKMKKAALRLLKTAGVGDSVRKGGKKVLSAVGKGFERVGNKAIDTASGEKGLHQYSSSARRQSLGKKITGGAAGGAAAVGGGGYAAGKDRKKKAGLEDVAEAIDTLRAAGYAL